MANYCEKEKFSFNQATTEIIVFGSQSLMFKCTIFNYPTTDSTFRYLWVHFVSDSSNKVHWGAVITRIRCSTEVILCLFYAGDKWIVTSALDVFKASF